MKFQDDRIILQRDNKFVPKNLRLVKIEADKLEQEVVQHFGWRTPTKSYKTFTERFKAVGSYEYDKFLDVLSSKGY